MEKFLLRIWESSKGVFQESPRNVRIRDDTMYRFYRHAVMTQSRSEKGVFDLNIPAAE
jgi:hypothetical protein